MTYAPYFNDNLKGRGRVLGAFREKEFDHYFEYAERFDFPEDFHPELPHVVFVHDGQMRLANVKKTVLTMLVDEDEFEKWAIKSHIVYKPR
jgi:hypothetical protein